MTQVFWMKFPLFPIPARLLRSAPGLPPAHLPGDVSEPGEFPLTLLGNGTVLASGGLIEGFPKVSTSAANLYNPATGTWTNTGFMNTDRRQHTATLLQSSGEVLVAGGISGTLGTGGVTNASAELYYPASETWTNTGSMHTARSGHAAALLANGSVLVAGGLQDTSSELYSPASGTWSTTGSLNELRFGASAIAPAARAQVLIVGGANDSSAELYDPSTGKWTYANNLLAEQENATATLLPDGTVLVAGGTDANGQYSSFAETYDPTTGSWTQTGTMNTPRADASAVLLANGVVLVAGGDGASGALADAELYYPCRAMGPARPDMLKSRDEFVSALLPDGRVLATGGFDSTAELYTAMNGAAGFHHLCIVLPDGSFQFSFTNTPGSTNIVFATTNLTASFSTWHNLGTAPASPATLPIHRLNRLQLHRPILPCRLAVMRAGFALARSHGNASTTRLMGLFILGWIALGLAKLNCEILYSFSPRFLRWLCGRFGSQKTPKAPSKHHQRNRPRDEHT